MFPQQPFHRCFYTGGGERLDAFVIARLGEREIFILKHPYITL